MMVREKANAEAGEAVIRLETQELLLACACWWLMVWVGVCGARSSSRSRCKKQRSSPFFPASGEVLPSKQKETHHQWKYCAFLSYCTPPAGIPQQCQCLDRGRIDV